MASVTNMRYGVIPIFVGPLFCLPDAPRGQVGNVFVMEIRQNKGGSMKQGQKMGIATISDDMRTKRIAKISNRTK